MALDPNLTRPIVGIENRFTAYLQHAGEAGPVAWMIPDWGTVYGKAGYRYLTSEQVRTRREDWEEGEYDAFVRAMENAVPLFAAPHPHQAPEGWRPIETAPKDGTRVDLWRQGHRVTDAFWDEGEEWWCIDSRYSDGEPCPLAVSPEPTHWRPLPAPPASPCASADQGGE